jgi:predicted small secreted protein
MGRIVLAALVAIGVAAALSACNTVEGAGKDIKRAGQWIEEKAGEKK